MNITHSITNAPLMIVFYSLDTLEIWIIHNLWEKNLCLYRKDTWMLSIVCNICASRASIIKYVYSRPLRLLKWHITCNQFANWNRMHYLGPYLFSLVKCHNFFTIATVTSFALFKTSWYITKRIIRSKFYPNQVHMITNIGNLASNLL